MLVAHLLLAAALQQAAPARVDVTPETAVIEVDETVRFSVAVYDSAGAIIAGPQMRWIVQNDDVASVDEASGTVTALRPGEAALVVLVEGGKIGRVQITVPELPAAKLTADLPEAPLYEGESVQASVAATNRIGDEVPVSLLRPVSTRPDVAWADEAGRVYGLKPGKANIRFAVAGDDARPSLEGPIVENVEVEVLPNRAVEYAFEEHDGRAPTGGVVRLRVSAVDGRGRSIRTATPVWLVDSPRAWVEAEGSDGVFVAERPGRYRVTALIGEHETLGTFIDVHPRAELREETALIQLGRGANAEHHSGDTWAFEGVDGRDYAYIGTFQYDWMRAWDVTDPTAPVLTDSLQLDARRINDVKIHPNNRIGILTREGASDRRNGIVLLDLSNPAHPSVLSEYEDTVTGGVHNVWIDGEHDLVYACHNGTSELHIIDISDPAAPAEVGRWGIDKTSKTLHDVIVQDGYAYLSYWNDGLVILDAGAGTHGGTPRAPTFVSRIAYPQGNTHTAFRYGRYVFVGDEIFPGDWDPEKPIEARGYIHVIDVEDIEAPHEVAKYEVPEAGAHNMWVEDDKLYVGYYQAGLRVVDVSGELRGDLYRQGRELAVLKTGALDSTVPNWGMTWGAQLHKGNIFTSDLNSGLWIARLQQGPLVP